jgi:hypothetical protein
MGMLFSHLNFRGFFVVFSALLSIVVFSLSCLKSSFGTSNVVVVMVLNPLSLVAGNMPCVGPVPVGDVSMMAPSINCSTTTMKSHMVMVSGFVIRLVCRVDFSMSISVDFVEFFVGRNHLGVLFLFTSDESRCDLSHVFIGTSQVFLPLVDTLLSTFVDMGVMFVSV